MEYSECLDAAAGEQDSLKRLAFVTGFAMSNYASTIGRIAKPFNPMLSETFELANLDKKYRYSERHSWPVQTGQRKLSLRFPTSFRAGITPSTNVGVHCRIATLELLVGPSAASFPSPCWWMLTQHIAYAFSQRRG